MLLLERFGQKTVGQPSIFFMQVVIEMATEEKAGVRGDERQEASLPRGVAESLNVRDRIEADITGPKSRAAWWCSSSMSLPSRARSRLAA